MTNHLFKAMAVVAVLSFAAAPSFAQSAVTAAQHAVLVARVEPPADPAHATTSTATQPDADAQPQGGVREELRELKLQIDALQRAAAADGDVNLPGGESTVTEID